jgi:hypothetical protein
VAVNLISGGNFSDMESCLFLCEEEYDQNKGFFSGRGLFFYFLCMALLRPAGVLAGDEADNRYIVLAWSALGMHWVQRRLPGYGDFSLVIILYGRR